MNKTELSTQRFLWEQQRDKDWKQIELLTRSTDLVQALILRNIMLEWSIERPWITGFSFTAEWVYDDEASSDWVPTFHLEGEQTDEFEDEDEADELFDDAMRSSGVNEEQIMLAFDVAQVVEGSITVVDLQKAWEERP